MVNICCFGKSLCSIWDGKETPPCSFHPEGAIPAREQVPRNFHGFNRGRRPAARPARCPYRDTPAPKHAGNRFFTPSGSQSFLFLNFEITARRKQSAENRPLLATTLPPLHGKRPEQRGHALQYRLGCRPARLYAPGPHLRHGPRNRPAATPIGAQCRRRAPPTSSISRDGPEPATFSRPAMAQAPRPRPEKRRSETLPPETLRVVVALWRFSVMARIQQRSWPSICT